MSNNAPTPELIKEVQKLQGFTVGVTSELKEVQKLQGFTCQSCVYERGGFCNYNPSIPFSIKGGNPCNFHTGLNLGMVIEEEEEEIDE
jgi:hypothetical protein